MLFFKSQQHVVPNWLTPTEWLIKAKCAALFLFVILAFFISNHFYACLFFKYSILFSCYFS